jgi:hypothetical protein
MEIIKISVSRAGDVAQAIEHLPTKCKAVNSNSNTANKEKRKNNLP